MVRTAHEGIIQEIRTFHERIIQAKRERPKVIARYVDGKMRCYSQSKSFQFFYEYVKKEENRSCTLSCEDRTCRNYPSKKRKAGLMNTLTKI